MRLAPAPFHAALAEGPERSCAVWAHSPDGVRLRIGHYPSTADRGTVLLFPGRTEYVEKYGRTAALLAEAGYHTLTIDWRGQGLADRMLHDPRTGHVHLFEDYQQDVTAMVAAARKLDLPRPYHLLAHSMGGCIGLRAVMDGLPVASCAFTGPMWGIRIAGAMRPAAWALSWSSARVGLGHVYAPGTRGDSYVASEAFEGNTLTNDPDTWEYIRRQVEAVPELQLGGPSLHWLHQALAECRALARRPSPDLPCLALVGSQESIVDIQRIESRMTDWPRGRLDVVPGGRHEVLMEGGEAGSAVIASIVALFDSAGTDAESLSA